MAKNYIYLKGKLSWCRHVKPDDKYGEAKWSVKMHLDNDSVEIARGLQEVKDGVRGIRNVLGKDDDGYYMTFSRKQAQIIRGKLVAFPPPNVVNPDGSPFGDKAIGNGSDGTIKLDLYTHNIPGGGRGRALRWEGLRVDNLVPFEVSKDLYPEQQEAIAPLVNQPAPQF